MKETNFCLIFLGNYNNEDVFEHASAGNETIVSEGGYESMSLGSYKLLNNIKNKLNSYEDIDLENEVFLKQSLKSQQSSGYMNITTTT